jgi:hypothetical protein
MPSLRFRSGPRAFFSLRGCLGGGISRGTTFEGVRARPYPRGILWVVGFEQSSGPESRRVRAVMLWWIARRRAAARTANDAVIAGTRTITANDAIDSVQPTSEFTVSVRSEISGSLYFPR